MPVPSVQNLLLTCFFFCLPSRPWLRNSRISATQKKKHGIKRKHEEFVVLFRNPDSFSGSPDKKSVIPIVTAANSDKKFA